MRGKAQAERYSSAIRLFEAMRYGSEKSIQSAIVPEAQLMEKLTIADAAALADYFRGLRALPEADGRRAGAPEGLMAPAPF